MIEKPNNWPSGMKRTKQREAVLAALERADLPVSAADICAQTEKSVSLSTVYRIVEMLIKKGVVTKVAVMNSDTALYEINRFRHKHYAVCVRCHKIISVDNCPMEKFIPKLGDDDFHVMGHNLEIYGYCGECDAKI